MSYLKIEEYNISLVNSEIPINIIDYVKKVNELECKINDISFIDDFIKLINRKDFCIHHSMLQTYGVLSIKDTADVKRLLNRHKFEKNIDYNTRKSAGITKSNNEYYLTPESFKLCLMRSQNVKIYSRYYLLIEISMAYFSKYQLKLSKKHNIEKDKIIEQKDDKIDILIKDIKEIKKQNEEILKINKRMELQLEDSNDKIYDMHDELEITNEKLDDTTKTVNLVAKKLDIAVEDRVSRPRKLSRLEYFIIMKTDTNTDYKYYIIRGQKGYANRQKNKLDEYTEIKTIECCPNANILWCLLKEQLINNIEYHGNKLNIINMNEDIFLENIETIYNTRKIVEIN